MDLGVATQPTYLRDTPIPGDKISFGDFDLEFIVDEDFENYLEIHNWIRGLGYPKDVGEYQRLMSKRQEEFSTRSTKELNNMYSDGSFYLEQQLSTKYGDQIQSVISIHIEHSSIQRKGYRL